MAVPVITVPNPLMVKTRSTGNRKIPPEERSSISPESLSRTVVNSEIPWPVADETGRIGAPSKKVPFKNSLISSWTRSNQSSSTRSILVRTTSPFFIPRRVQISRCSRVWGMTPSSAAIIRATRSMVLAPATIFLINRS